jgi:hypothetical protein
VDGEHGWTCHGLVGMWNVVSPGDGHIEEQFICPCVWSVRVCSVLSIINNCPGTELWGSGSSGISRECGGPCAFGPGPPYRP